jgi:hypothetical protein
MIALPKSRHQLLLSDGLEEKQDRKKPPPFLLDVVQWSDVWSRVPTGEFPLVLGLPSTRAISVNGVAYPNGARERSYVSA